MSDCFVLYLLLTCMKKKTSGADKFTNNTGGRLFSERAETSHYKGSTCSDESSEKDACINGTSFGCIY